MPSKLPVLALLLLLASLLLAVSAGHAAPAPPTVPLAFEEELEFEEEGEFEAGECEIAEVEFELGELGQREVDEICAEEASESKKAGSAAPGKCVLRSTRAHAATKHGKLKLTIGYTTSDPVNATIKIRNGKARGTYRRHLGRSGVLRFTEPLHGKEAKRRTEVRIKLPKGGTRCPSQRLVLFPK